MLQLFKDNNDDKTKPIIDDSTMERITIILVCSLSMWFILNVVFICSIDVNYLVTFFDLSTGPQFVRNTFLTGTNDRQRFNAAFTNRSSYIKPIEDDVKAWVELNINDWMAEQPAWFKIENIPDSYLPAGVLASVGGANRRRRNTVSLREIIGLDAMPTSQVTPNGLGDNNGVNNIDKN